MKHRKTMCMFLVDGWLLAAAVSPCAKAQSFAYISNSGSNSVSVIDTTSNTIVATIQTQAPGGVAITPSGAFAYVTNGSGANTVSVINTDTNSVVATVPVGNGPGDVAITPNGALACVTNFYSNTVSVIDTASNTVVATVPVGNEPLIVATTPNGSFAYLVNLASDTVSVISTASNTVVATVPVGHVPTGIAITPNGAFAYVANQQSSTVSVIDTFNNTVVANVPVGQFPARVAITPNGAFVYVSNEGPNTVTVINTGNNTVVATVPVGSVPKGVSITHNGTLAYVANTQSNTVSVINIAANAVVTTLPVGTDPEELAITRFLDNDSAFAQLYGSNNFSGNQTVNGNVTATNFVGNGAGLTGVNAATANTANYAMNAGMAASATNAAALGGVSATNYARLDIDNNFTGNQNVNGNLVVRTPGSSIFAYSVYTVGTLSIGGGTPIAEYVSTTLSVNLPSLTSGSCTTFTTAALTGYTPGTSDTIALGVPSDLVSLSKVFVIWQAWETSTSVSPTITVQVCNPSAARYAGGASDTIRIDVFKH